MPYNLHCSRVALSVLVAAAGMVCGCGGGSADDLPQLAPVRGVVTLDGKPLAGAAISFEPSEAGGISSGVTAEDGSYELSYPGGHQGAVIGSHVVRISKLQEDDAGLPIGEETIPVIFNDESELKVEVEADKENELNLELKSP